MSYEYAQTTEGFTNPSEDCTICMSEAAANNGLGCNTLEGFRGGRGGRHGGRHGGRWGGRWGGRYGGYWGGYYGYPYYYSGYPYYAVPQVTRVVQAPAQTGVMQGGAKMLALAALAVGVLALYKK